MFIGGAIAPILQVDPPFRQARLTDDVDGVAATTSYADHVRMQKRLRALGFREAREKGGPAHRWLAPDNTIFDLVPAGDHFGASGHQWDAVAIETAETTRLSPGTRIRHASAPAFLALKWAAFRDRGRTDPFASHDLEDILAIVVSRPAIADELRLAPAPVRSFVGAECRKLLKHADIDDLLPSHLNNAFDPAATILVARERLAELGARRRR